MKITEQQIMKLIFIAHLKASQGGNDGHDIYKLLTEIARQQSTELREIE
jgi:hypothetical protein